MCVCVCVCVCVQVVTEMQVSEGEYSALKRQLGALTVEVGVVKHRAEQSQDRIKGFASEEWRIIKALGDDSEKEV